MEIISELFRETFSVYSGNQAQTIYSVLFVTSPIWLPIFLSFAFWFVWIRYIRSLFIAKQKFILLELRLPPEVYKSPLAMELVLSGLHQTGGEGDWYKRYIKGQMRLYSTFEIVSNEGNVHLYVWTRESFKNLVEAQFYGQYPNIEIQEVPDYTDMIAHYDAKKFELWGIYYKLNLPDPYPIKTYVDYGLDKDPKEEFKIDPLTSVLEYMSLMGKGEYLWLQIGFRAHKEKGKGASWFEKTSWQDETRKVIDDMYKAMERVEENEDNERTFRRQPTKGETMALERLERSITKPAFDVGIRSMYFAEPGQFKSYRISGLANLLKQFGGVTFQNKKEQLSYAYNSFGGTHSTDYDLPWEDFMQMREMKNRHHIVDGYRRRQFFHAPHIEHTFILNAEELATIFHPVGTVLQTPTVERVISRKSEAPRNLPR